MRNFLFVFVLATLNNVRHAAADCNDYLKSYTTPNYNAPICNFPLPSEQDGELDNRCRFDIVDEEATKATDVITTLTGHGYRLCFGCGKGEMIGHCPKVAICAKDAKCFKRQTSRGNVFGCCDTTCGACTGQCEGHLCNGDANLQNLVDQYLPKPTTTPLTSTVSTTVTIPTTTADYYSPWTSWSSCFPTNCPFDGVEVRSRQCLHASGTCAGLASENRICHTPLCTTTAPPNYWSDWSSWSRCFATSCFGQGFRVRTRTCQLGLGQCTGTDTQNDNCVAPPCSAATATNLPISTVTTTAALTTSNGLCTDDDDAITNTCAYWVQYRICERGTASFTNIGSVYCRKTCGLCI